MSFFKNIKKKITNATQNLFSENNEYIKNIFFSLQSPGLIISKEKYESKEYINYMNDTIDNLLFILWLS